MYDGDSEKCPVSLVHHCDQLEETRVSKVEQFMDCSVLNDKANSNRDSILIVDDQIINITLLRATLESQYDVHHVASGLEAIALLSTRSFDLIILDVMMPGITGFDTLRRLKNLPRFGKTPVVFMTALGAQESETEGLSLGAADYIIKPFKTSLVRLRIANLLERTKLETNLNMALDSAQLGLWEMDVCTSRVRITPRGGVRPNVVSSGPDIDIFWEETLHPESLVTIRAAILDVVSGSANQIDQDVRLLDQSGRWTWINLYGTPTKSCSCSHATRITGTYRDITSRKEAEAGKAISDERLRMVMEAIGEGVWDWDIASGHISHNSSWCRMLGLDAHFLEHDIEYFKSLIHPSDQKKVAAEIIKATTSNRPYVCKYRIRKSNGDYLWIEDRGNVVARSDDEDAVAIRMVGSIRDISKQHEDEETIYKLAYYDFLTGLPNRRLLVDRIRQAIAGNTRSGQFSALLFIDMDHFKQLNDTHGHEAGDELLKEVAKRLRSTIREYDTVSRLGGDEFVVLLNTLGHEDRLAHEIATEVGKNILSVLDTPYQIGDITHISTPSIGAVLFSGRPADTEAIIKRADDAMYKAKAAGRNCLRFAEGNC